MKKAIAYVSDVILGRTGDVISREYQKKEIEAHAKANDIEIVAWFEDEMYNEDTMTRKGVQDLLSYDKPFDAILVERVWCFSRRWPVLEQLFAECERHGKKVESATCMWDCISQMSRRRFDATLTTPIVREVVTREEAGPLHIRRPAKLHFAKIATKA
jgi:DNA invertase Pin-like site-specific DNA recombinase